MRVCYTNRNVGNHNICKKHSICKICDIIVSAHFVTYGISMKLTISTMKMITCCTLQYPVHMQYHTSVVHSEVHFRDRHCTM